VSKKHRLGALLAKALYFVVQGSEVETLSPFEDDMIAVIVVTGLSVGSPIFPFSLRLHSRTNLERQGGEHRSLISTKQTVR